MDPKKQKILLGVLAALVLGAGAFYTLGGSGSANNVQTTGEKAVRKTRTKSDAPTEVKRKEKKVAEEKPEVAERKVKEEKEAPELAKRKEKTERAKKIEKKKDYGTAG